MNSPPSITFVRRLCLIILISVSAVVGTGMNTQVGAHFLLNLNVRIYHVEHTQNGLTVLLRTPMPYLVADKVGEAYDNGLPDAAPFTTNAFLDGQLVHYLDKIAVEDAPLGLGRIAEESLVIEFNGERLRGEVDAVVISVVGSEAGFATLHEAQSALSLAGKASVLPNGLFVGDALVDIAIHYNADSYVAAYSMSNLLDPGLPEQELTANLILDYGPGDPKVFRSRGLMAEPIEVSRSRLQAFATFVWEGGRHILEGIDHVLFVICLILGAETLRGLLARVTGFTIGHSVTLATGFFGFVPSGAWFVPAVETGIAVSIVYAAYLVLRPNKTKAQGRSVFFVTLLLGLLHGLGFSFVLHDILKVTSPNIWQSLLAFNVGVELGQLFIVAIIWPLLRILQRVTPRFNQWTRKLAAVLCLGVATVWTVERSMQLVGV